MFDSIRKHQKWLLVLISGLTIISFVAFFNPAQSSLRGVVDGGENFGRLYGRPIARETMVTFGRQAQLFGRLRFGDQADSAQARQMGYDPNVLRYQRLFLDAKLKEFGITVSDAAVADWIRLSLPKDPKTGQVNYDKFIDEQVKPHFTEAEFQQFARQEAGMQQLREVVGVTGQLLTPREAEAEFRRENEQAVASAVFFAASNYLADVKMDAAALGQFFTNRVAEYRIPERTVISYVRWVAADFLTNAAASLAKLPDLNKQIESAYEQRGAEAFKDKLGVVQGKADALASLREQAVETRALAEAGRAARDFANELYAMEPAKPGNLAVVAAKYGLFAQETPPFSGIGAIPGLEDAPDLARESFRLTPDQPFTKPVEARRAYYLAALVRKLPSEVPALDSVQVRVTADYKRVKSQEALRAAGEAFAAAVTAALAQGKSFAAAAAELNSKPVQLEPFSLVTQTLSGLDLRFNFPQLKDTAFNLKSGSASRFIAGSEGGFVLFLKERRPVDEAIVKAGLNGYLEEQRRQRQDEAFGEWFQKEFSKSGLAALVKRKSDDQF